MSPTLIIFIVQAIIEIVKLIMQLRKTNPVAAEQCSVALREARKTGDTSRLRQILDSMENGNGCDVVK